MIYEPESLLAIRFIDGLTRDGEMDAAYSVLRAVTMLFVRILPSASFEAGGFYFWVKELGS